MTAIQLECICSDGELLTGRNVASPYSSMPRTLTAKNKPMRDTMITEYVRNVRPRTTE